MTLAGTSNGCAEIQDPVDGPNSIPKQPELGSYEPDTKY